MLLLPSVILAFTGGRTKAKWVPLRGNWNNYLHFVVQNLSASLYRFTLPTPNTDTLYFILLAATDTSKHLQTWLASLHSLSSLLEGAFFYYQNIPDFKILSFSWVLLLLKYRLLLRWYWSFQLSATCPNLYYAGTDQHLLCLIAFLTVNEK